MGRASTARAEPAADIWGTADSFQIVSQTVNGDFGIRTRVGSQTNTNVWARAGVMIRDGTAANAPHVIMAATPGNGFAMAYRTTTGEEFRSFPPDAWSRCSTASRQNSITVVW